MIIKLRLKKKNLNTNPLTNKDRGMLQIFIGENKDNLHFSGQLDVNNDELMDLLILMNGGKAFWNEHLDLKNRFVIETEGIDVSEPTERVRKLDLED